MKTVHMRQVCQRGEESWAEVPVAVCVECGISLKRPRRGDFVYVQGEDPITLMEVRLEKHGLAPRYTQCAVEDFKAWLKSDQWPKAAKWKGD